MFSAASAVLADVAVGFSENRGSFTRLIVSSMTFRLFELSYFIFWVCGVSASQNQTMLRLRIRQCCTAPG